MLLLLWSTLLASANKDIKTDDMAIFEKCCVFFSVDLSRSRSTKMMHIALRLVFLARALCFAAATNTKYKCSLRSSRALPGCPGVDLIVVRCGLGSRRVPFQLATRNNIY